MDIANIPGKNCTALLTLTSQNFYAPSIGIKLRSLSKIGFQQKWMRSNVPQSKTKCKDKVFRVKDYKKGQLGQDAQE